MSMSRPALIAPTSGESEGSGSAVAKTVQMRIALSIAATVLALAACSGSSKPGSSTSPQSQGASTSSAGHQSATSQTTSTPSAAKPTPTPSATGAGAGLCRSPGLSLSFLGGQGATGHGVLSFELRNVSSGTCHTFGFPGIQFLDNSGRPLPTASRRTTQDFFGNAPEKALDVAPGASVSFRIGVTHGIPSNAGCTTAAGLSVIPPNDTGSLHVTIPQGAYECRTATVTPVEPGRSAYP